MTNTPSLEDTLKAAQGLVEQRLAAVEAHKRNVDAENAARQELAERERETARTWSDLLASGWTVAELRRIPGFSEPKVKVPGRPRTKRKAPTPTTPEVPAQLGATVDAGESAETTSA
ncbi:hypothetical protein [Streptomyces canus]|uniref:hypothetical protein n=1 Tax=Streptomyces canus TaxID=58343 RepID=UPI002E267E5E